MIKRIGKAARVIALAAAFAFAAAAPAAAHTAGIARNACGNFTTRYATFAPNYEGETWFTFNPNGCAQHVALKCRDRFGTVRWINPPWVVNNLVRSGANCPATWSPVQLNVDVSPPTYGQIIYIYVDYRY